MFFIGDYFFFSRWTNQQSDEQVKVKVSVSLFSTDLQEKTELESWHKRFKPPENYRIIDLRKKNPVTFVDIMKCSRYPKNAQNICKSIWTFVSRSTELWSSAGIKSFGWLFLEWLPVKSSAVNCWNTYDQDCSYRWSFHSPRATVISLLKKQEQDIKVQYWVTNIHDLIKH